METRKDFAGLMNHIMSEPSEPMSWDGFWAKCRNTERQDYCTQNAENCETCSLVSYGKDCRNNKI